MLAPDYAISRPTACSSAGYTMLLVAYEGSTHPLNAWSIAADRIAEILIGIACGALASVIILPRYAGDALREAQANTVSGLAHYVATALHLSTPAAVFARLRKQMVAEVVSFDALRASLCSRRRNCAPMKNTSVALFVNF